MLTPPRPPLTQPQQSVSYLFRKKKHQNKHEKDVKSTGSFIYYIIYDDDAITFNWKITVAVITFKLTEYRCTDFLDLPWGHLILCTIQNSAQDQTSTIFRWFNFKM